MKKRILSTFLALAMCLSLLPTAALATGPGYPRYIAADGTTKDLTETCQKLSVQEEAQNKYTATVSDGWYHIDQDIEGKTISTLTVNGTVNLVLYGDRANSIWINSITGNGTLNIYAGRSDDRDSVGNYVSCVLESISGVSVNLYGGRYSTFNRLPESGWALGHGFCFLYYENEAEVYTTTFSGGLMKSEFATVVPCPHKTVDDGKCSVCQTQCTACGITYNGPEPDTKYYTSVAAAMNDSCNTVQLLADCNNETVRCSPSGTTVDLNGHRLKELSVEMQGSTEFSFTIEDNSEAKTGTITTLTVNSKTTLKGGNFGTITTGKNGGNIPLPVGYAFQHTGENDSGTDFVKRSEIGSSLFDVKVVEVGACTTHEYADGMCELCGEECQHGTVSDEGVCSTCNQQFAGKVTINNGTPKWFAAFSKAWQEIMKQKNSPVPVHFDLYQDVKADGQLDVTGLDLILCLNGHTLERENFDATNGKLSLTSGDGKSGTLVGPVESGTGGQFSTSGDVTINGDVTLGSSNDSLGVGTMILGKVTSTSGKNIQDHLSGTHPVLFTKDTDGNYTQFVSGNETEIAGPVKVVECTTHSYADGKCEYCGYVCYHTVNNEQNGTYNIDDSTGKCRGCQKQFVLKDGNGKYYDDFSYITLSGSNNNILLCDVEKDVTLYSNDNNLDLNGHTLNGTISLQGAGTTPKFTLKDTKGGGSLTALNNSGGGEISVYSGHVGTLSGSFEGIKLYGGTYEKIGAGNGTKLTDLKLLPDGYAFQHTGKNNSGTELVKRSELDTTQLSDVGVIKHNSDKHTDADNDALCDFCGVELVAKVTGGETETYYDSFSGALDNTEAGQTVTLLSDVTLTESISLNTTNGKKAITLDLNGKTISDGNGNSSIQILNGTTVTLSDSSDKASGKITSPITVSEYQQSAGNLIVNSAVTLGSVTVSAGTLTVNANANFTDLEITGGTAKLNGGTFSKLSVGTGEKLTDKITLGEGRALRKTDTNAWLNSSDLAVESLSNVAVKIVPIQSLTISGVETVEYGEQIKLTANVITVTSADLPGEALQYSWNVAENTVSSKATFTGTANSVGSVTYTCTVTMDGYSVQETRTVEVTKATLVKGTDYGDPKANNGLIYNAQEQGLVNAPSTIPTDTTVYYSIDRDSWNSDISKITATNAGTYTVYWYIDGGTNYKDVGSDQAPAGTIEVTIAPKNINEEENGTYINVMKQPLDTYDGTVKNMGSIYALWSESDNESPLERLKEGTDYTLSGVLSATDAGSYGFTITGKGNYTGTRTTSWSISKATYGDQTVSSLAEISKIGAVDLSNLIMPEGKAEITKATDTNSILSSGPSISGTQLEFSIKNNIGSDQKAVIEVSVTGCKNYENYTITVTLSTTSGRVPMLTANNITRVYTGEPIPESAITGTAMYEGETVAGTWSFTDNKTFTNVSDSKKAVSVTFTPEDTNFAPATTTIKVTITKATLPQPNFGKISEAGKTLLEVDWDLDGVLATLTWDDGDYTSVEQGKSYAWTLTPVDTDNYKVLTGTYIPWPTPVSVGGGGSSSSSASTTVKNPDGSTTTTTTDKKTGEVTETTTMPNGTTSTTVTDKNGDVTGISASIPAVAAKNGETVKLPINEVNTEKGTTIDVEVPAGGVTVEVPVEDPTVGTVIVIVDKEGNETVVPTSKVTENGIEVTLTEDATIKVIDNAKDFSDVEESDYFGNAVDWASSRGITGGNSATTFGPHESCTRAQLVTFLWRAAGQPEAESESGMSDVADGTYYTEAVAWAVENGIVDGYGNGQLGTEDAITREQMAVILYRFAQTQGKGFTDAWAFRLDFADVSELSDWAVEGISWCVMNGIMQGYDGKLMPKEECTRAQIVTMLYRLLGK